MFILCAGGAAIPLHGTVDQHGRVSVTGLKVFDDVHGLVLIIFIYIG